MLSSPKKKAYVIISKKSLPISLFFNSFHILEFLLILYDHDIIYLVSTTFQSSENNFKKIELSRDWFRLISLTVLGRILFPSSFTTMQTLAHLGSRISAKRFHADNQVVKIGKRK